jgi:hypothetical protein
MYYQEFPIEFSVVQRVLLLNVPLSNEFNKFKKAKVILCYVNVNKNKKCLFKVTT